MKQLQSNHPLVQIINENLAKTFTVFLHEASDGNVEPAARRAFRSTDKLDMVLGVAAAFKHEQFEILVMQDIRRMHLRGCRMQFFVCIMHPETETRWGVSEETEFTDTSAFTCTHPQLGINKFRIDYDDSAKTNRFKLSIIALTATSMEQFNPAAFSETQLAALTRN